MNNVNIKAIGAILFGLVFGLYVIVEALLSRTSSLGALYLWAAIGALILGLTNPKPAIYAMLLCTVYIDLFKRLMVIGGNPTFVEVGYVLAIPPLLVGGAVTTVFLGIVLGRRKMTKDMLYSLIASIMVILLTVGGAVLQAGGIGGSAGLSAIVNQGFYSFLLFIIPALFPSDEERRKLLHFSFVTFIPAVLYMFWQRQFGYAEFEYDYLMTGLTIEVKNITESLGQVRCFSTFNGAGTASMLISMYVVYCFIPMRPHNWNATPFQRIGKLILAPLFILAAYFTIVRTGWVSGVVCMFSYFLLGGRFRSTVFAISAVVGFIIIVLLAPTAIEQRWLAQAEKYLQEVAGALSDDPTIKRAIVLGTAEDRLVGWANLTEQPKIWQPFGFAAAGIDYEQTTNNDFRWGHDAIVDTLIKFGYVPLFSALTLGAYMLKKLFDYMYGLDTKSLAFKNTRLCLTFIAGTLVSAISSPATFRNFPQNFFFVLWIAVPFATYQQAMRERKQALSKTPAIDATSERYPTTVTVAHAN